ncbi:MAG: hypothetical protein K2X90_02370 [Candidatus Babeliaceae bacterium]|nr:hypothetical protein [Candidatus Babeliaceae bacterium]
MKRLLKTTLFFLSIFLCKIPAHQQITSISASNASLDKAEDLVTARVFIHGTVLIGCFFVDIPGSWRDQYSENSLIERAMASARKHPFLHHSEIVLDLGLTDITQEIMVPLSHPLTDEKAAISIIRTFERTDRCVSARRGAYHYYTFGWSGALSERKRNKESGYLYEKLLEIKSTLTQQYPNARIKFELYAHSHGGQLIAHLPIIRKNRGNSDLYIDLAVLCATPLYKEKMQPMVSSSMFGTIINFYSCGDKVQNLDIISTPQHYCVRTLKELEIPLPTHNKNGPRVLDVCLSVHNNPYVFSHESFFCCTTYRLPSHYRKRRHIRKTLNLFGPLPVLVLYPACIKSIESLNLVSGFHSVIMNLEHKRNTCIALSVKHQTQFKESAAFDDTRYYKIQPLSFDFLKEYGYRARTSRSNQLKYTFYHIMHS